MKDLPHDITMMVKRAKKPTLHVAVEEALLVKKDILSLKPSSEK